MALRLRGTALGPLSPALGAMVATALGLGHLVVDLGSHLVLLRSARWSNPDDLILAFLAFNFFQLGIQPVFGLVSDRLRRPPAVALFGLGVLACSLWVPPRSLWLAIALAGLGNTLYHLGAGTTAMRAMAFRAAGPGLFIAPGAMGVAAARALGKALDFPTWPVAALLGVTALVVVLARAPAAAEETAPGAPTLRWWPMALALLLGAVALRSLVGLRVVAAFAGHDGWGVPLAVAILAGKALGGAAADRAGWRVTATAGLLASAVLFLAAGDRLWVAALSLLLFQAVTGITVAALWQVLPRRPGFAFSLNSLALFVGCVPVLGRVALPTSLLLDSALTILAAAAVWSVLTILRRGAQGPSTSGRWRVL